MHALAQREIRFLEPQATFLGHEPDALERLELADVVGELDELGVARRVREHPVVDEELDVGDTARVLLDVERAGLRERELLAHPARASWRPRS